jgi:hypothetical protein
VPVAHLDRGLVRGKDEKLLDELEGLSDLFADERSEDLVHDQLRLFEGVGMG